MHKTEIFLGNQPIKVWPQGQTITPLAHPTILVTQFTDTALYHPRLKTKILEMEQRPHVGKNYFRGACGTKVHHVERWGFSEAELIHARAMELYRRALSAQDAVVDWSWASVYRQDDHCMPHSHTRAKASIVYFLESGEANPQDPLSGSFYFADPRLPCCCQEEESRMTTLLRPTLPPGAMLIFPAQLVHSVNAYHGAQPRITMSWNISDVAIPGSPLPQDA